MCGKEISPCGKKKKRLHNNMYTMIRFLRNRTLHGYILI